jgi:MSHA pilin protein MshC
VIVQKCLRRLNHQQGFTLVELVMVIVVLSIVAATALPKFFDQSVFQERAFFDDTLAAVRYAQKLAVATGCNVQVNIAGTTFYLKRPSATNRSQCASTTAADFTRDVANPGSGEAQYSGSQSGISLTPATFYFNALGAVSTGLDINVGSTRKITVIKETGFVYDNTP